MTTQRTTEMHISPAKFSGLETPPQADRRAEDDTSGLQSPVPNGEGANPGAPDAQFVQHQGISSDRQPPKNESVTQFAEGKPIKAIVISQHTPAKTTTALATQAQYPTLAISHSAVTFAKTQPGKQQFAVLTVLQQAAVTPVTITTDAPEHFQLACDSRPVFLPHLTFTPSPTGSYVHVRYAPNKTGVHVGQLTLETPYDTQTVTLTGQSGAILLKAPDLRPIIQARGATRPSESLSRKSRLGLLASLLFCGLAYVSYLNRCTLAPSLCQTMAQVNESAPQAESSLTARSTAEPGSAGAKAIESSANQTVAKRTAALTAKKVKSAPKELAQKQLFSKNESSTKAEKSTEGAVQSSSTYPSNTFQKTEQTEPRQRQLSASLPNATEESDLERELNRKSADHY
ncbi:hypothetical protein ACFSUS_00775 [Spirosoma soli]|uniref:Uncharacterized protein n=1 Tax=Spirosoma soli TaxID=1770529 RepID=A0ABW5LYQ1_9BACT